MLADTLLAVNILQGTIVPRDLEHAWCTTLMGGSHAMGVRNWEVVKNVFAEGQTGTLERRKLQHQKLIGMRTSAQNLIRMLGSSI